MAAQQPARASPELRKAPLSPRYRRNYTTLRGTTDQSRSPEGSIRSLRDELLNEELFDTLDDARRKLALWRYDYNYARPYSSLGNKTPTQARRALEQFEGSAHAALAQAETNDYQPLSV